MLALSTALHPVLLAWPLLTVWHPVPPGVEPGIEHPGTGLAAAPAAATLPDGTFLVAWESRARGRSDILFNRRDPGRDSGWLVAPRRLDGNEGGGRNH